MTIYEALFGTPERAARTLEEGAFNATDFCFMLNALNGERSFKCANCLYDYDGFSCVKDNTISEWLNSEVVDE